MSQIVGANFSIGQFFKSASMFTPTSSIVTISAISSGSITFTPALSNYTTIRSASLSWLDSSSLSPFYSITGGGSFQSIDSTAFSVLFSFGSTTTIVTQSNSSFIFNSSSIVGASTRQFSISYLTQSIQSYYDDTVEEAYVQLTIDTTNNENSIKFDTGLLNSTTGEVEFTSNTPVKGGIGTSARGIGSFAMGSGSIAQESASIAEGINTLASGLASHAAGINTTASGQAAFSMGIETDADGMASFAAGSGSWAKGTATVAFGIGTIASASGQTVVGHYNLGLGDFNNLFVVGGGSGATTNLRKNLFRVYGGSGASTVGVEINTSETQNISSFDGFNVYGKTRFFGGVTGSAIDFNAIGLDTKTNQDPILGTITTGSFTSNFYRSQNVLGGGPLDFEDVLKASVRLDHRGINFSLSEQTTAPGSTFLWTNSSDRLFYGSSAVILNDGNTLGSAMTIGTTDVNNLQLETNNTTRIFISSSGNVGIGTSSPAERLHVQGNSLFSGSLKFEPTQDPDLAGLDTDSTILFQSSSNTLLGHDLYFRQNGNLVKWKWFEGILETGLLYGGIVTYSGSNVFVSPGSGIIVNHNVTATSEVGPIIDYVTWGPITQSITNISSSQVTYIYIDENGALQQQSTRFTSQQFHDDIPLGAVAHFNYSSISAFGGAVQTAYNQTAQILNFIDAFGPLKLSGYGLTGQSSSLSLSVGSGTSYIHGGFYDSDLEFPSQYETNAQVTASIAYVYSSGSGIRFDTNNNNFYTSLKPNFYDPGTGITASVSNNNWTIQRVYSDPRSGVLYIYYGRNVYPDYQNAIANLSTDSFSEGDTFDFTTFLGFLLLKSNTTDITNTTDNKIIPAGLFRGGGAAGGGGSAVTTLDDLTNVTITSPTNGQALVYNTGVWENGTPISSSYALTASFLPVGTYQITSSWATNALTASNITPSITNNTDNRVLTATGGGTINGESNLTFDGIVLTVTGSARIRGSGVDTVGALIIQNSGGTATFTVLNGGTTGVGENNPSARLHVKGSGATSATTALRVENSSAAARLTILDNGTSAFNTSHLYVSGSGRVGIGTTTPIAQLHVTNSMLVNGTSDYFGGIDTTVPIQMFAGVANNGIGFRTDNFYLYPYGNNTSLIYGWNGNAAWTLRNLNTSSFQIFNNSPTAAVMLTVSSSGNMGIGITSPTARLHVSGASNAGLFEIDSPTINNIIYVSGSGNVGIGTNLPSAELHISGASIDSLLRVGSPTQANTLFITGSNRVGIGTGTPRALFEVNNKIIAEAAGNVGIQTTPSEWIHLSSDPASSKYLRIDAVQNGNPPPDYNPNGGYQVNRLWGSTLDDNALGTPDYWMEIKLNGGIVLIPAYLPAP